ncbi:MAG: hypothetical protein ACR2RF_11870 [Geminicoccaceae bacterium]
MPAAWAEAHDRASGHALAAAALADQTDAALAPKTDRQIIDRHQRCRGHLG